MKPRSATRTRREQAEMFGSSSSFLLNCFLLFQVNAVDHLGQTALHRAARCGHLQTCRLLLSAGCDPLLTSLQGFSPSQLGNESVQEILQGVTTGRSLLGGLLICEVFFG